ncbi:calcium-binding and coiled-coil domain-containing protein 1-like isoform X1 [Archocentrus centrarchus]|uniref:calcium-binding and coiled-coil domain-containing protein 1-like isoform X1 n=1 Tax=Archocentrus centrarchus TaxID=63155 RepID=UPI0011EA446A|nr:calcium-binding and coiled-coil domain-containing protein 1-like isoform X1 [Archocentrus centrarchus]XP_030584931.1 calcium-binding and coiled-coil domain-containing protein 1-like isoform X1 [Archocentrus centrarchus]
MDKQPTVVFRNVGQVYFPQTRVECHYSLTSDHQWSSSDWIGIFEMGWSSVKQYYTYTWATVPEGYTEGTSVNYCAVFQASYLPRPSTVEYQFAYVDKMGEVCACSRPFTFCAPKPLEELETLKEEEDGEDGEEELLLVIPRAQLLQSQLEECLKKQADLQRALDVAKKETENEKENSREAKSEWEYEKEAMKEEILELRDSLRHSREMLKRTEGKHKDVKYSHETLTSELSKLVAEKAESEQRFKELEEDVKVLAEREKEQNNELERLRDRVRKMSCQMKHDEEKRKSLQMENEAALEEAQLLQERLEASDHTAECLRREVRELSTRQGHTHTELHQARLQVAQLTLQLSEENLLLREERANWALEREAYRHAAEIDKKKLQDLGCEVQKKEEWLQEERMEREKLEVQLGREKDYNKVLLGEAKRELQELKASLRTIQKEREEEQLQKQDLVNYIHQLEQRLGIVPETVSTCVSSGSTSANDENASSRSVSSPALLSTHLEQPGGAENPPETQMQSEENAPASDTQDGRCEPPAGERKQLILPELINPVLSELADSPMW